MNDSMITFSGWVGSQVEVAHVGEGVTVATFRVGSTPRRLRAGRWENGETLWYSVKSWRSLASHAASSLKVGDPVVVTGRLVAETWTKDDGTVQTRHVVVAVTIGHDLNRGTSSFTRTPPTEQAHTEQADVEQADTEQAGAGVAATVGDGETASDSEVVGDSRTAA